MVTKTLHRPAAAIHNAYINRENEQEATAKRLVSEYTVKESGGTCSSCALGKKLNHGFTRCLAKQKNVNPLSFCYLYKPKPIPAGATQTLELGTVGFGTL